MPDALQFSVTRLDINTYRVVVQNDKEIIRADIVDVKEIIDKLGYELEQLKFRQQGEGK